MESDQEKRAPMGLLVRSLLAALLLVGLVLTFTIRVVAPGLPRVVGAPEVQETRDFTWPGARHIRLGNTDGMVRVVTYSGSEVRAEVKLRVYARERGRKAEAEQYARDLVEVTLEGETVAVRTETLERPDLFEVYADYLFRVPQGASFDLSNENGNVSISGEVGAVQVRGRNADVVVEKAQDAVEVETLNGRIRAYDLVGGANLKTVNGNIYAHMLGGSLNGTTTNGAIVAQVLSPDVADCNLTSQNGGITVTLPEICGVCVDARTDSGAVRCDFSLDASGGVQTRRRLLGRIGQGDIQLHLAALNGNIWIARNRAAGDVLSKKNVESRREPDRQGNPT